MKLRLPYLLAKACTILMVLPVSASAADQPHRLTAHRMAWMTWIDDPQISPDARWVTYEQQRRTSLAGSPLQGIWLMTADGAGNTFIAKGSSVRWAPDSSAFLYTAPTAYTGEQLFIYDLKKKRSHVLTRNVKHPRLASWSPDGRAVAFIALIPESEQWPVDLSSLPEDSRPGAAPRIIDNLHYRESGTGFLERGYDHLFVQEIGNEAAPRQLTHGKWHVGARETGRTNLRSAGLAWNKDGTAILIDGLMSADYDLRSYESRIYKVSVSNGKVTQLPTPDDRGAWLSPQYSPDHKAIAYLGYSWEKRPVQHRTDIWLADKDGGQPTNLSAALDTDALDFFWAGDGSGVYFNAERHGVRGVWFAGRDAVVKPINVHHGRDLYITSMSRSGAAVGVVATPERPPDAVRLESVSKPPVRLTQANDAWLNDIDLGAVETLWYSGSNGAQLQTWIFYPPTFDKNKSYPVITFLHGGPRYMGSAALDWSGAFSMRNLAASGYVVLYPNYHGNTGYGSTVSDSILHGNWPNDYVITDILQAFLTVAEREYVDATRAYLIGESAGATLATWILSRTDRFAAAVVLWPDVDWVSASLTADDGLTRFFDFAKPFWEEPMLWFERSPPMAAHSIVTPTLIITGERDLRTPMAQTEELFAAMKIANRTRVRMVRFPDQDHGYAMSVANYIRMQAYIEAWLSEYGGTQ